MQSDRSALGCLLLAALLTAPSPAQADSTLLQDAAGLQGLAMFLESGAVGMSWPSSMARMTW